MSYLITTSKYPSDKAGEVAEKYLEALKKYPIDENLETELVPAAVKSTSQGIGILGVSEVKEGKLEEAYANKVKFMVLFQGIKGFEYSIDINSTVVEALEVLGISPPE